MNITIEINDETVSEGDDNYGAGGAFPERGPAWAESLVAGEVAMLIVPGADDLDQAEALAGEVVAKSTTVGTWPDVDEWVGIVTSIRGVESFRVSTR